MQHIAICDDEQTVQQELTALCKNILGQTPISCIASAAS